MVASPMLNNQNYQKGEEATMKEKTKTLTKQPMEEILNFFQQEVNNLIKNLLEKLMLEERRIYLEEIEDYCKRFLYQRFTYKVWEGSRFKSASGQE